jgi:hypothetical protein
VNRPRATAVRRWAATMLLVFSVALVLAQSQGLLHSVVHGQHFRAVTIAQDGALERPRLAADAGLGHDHKHRDHGEADEPVAAQPGAFWLLRLFVGHDDESTCRLFDQSSHTDFLALVTAQVLPPLPPAPVLAVRATPAPQLAPAPTRARGPPPTKS